MLTETTPSINNPAPPSQWVWKKPAQLLVISWMSVYSWLSADQKAALFYWWVFSLSLPQGGLCVLAMQSVFEESLPRPSIDAVRGEMMPSCWILQPIRRSGKEVTRVTYLLQVRRSFYTLIGCLPDTCVALTTTFQLPKPQNVFDQRKPALMDKGSVRVWMYKFLSHKSCVKCLWHRTTSAQPPQ